jgi:hypothetical protein
MPDDLEPLERPPGVGGAVVRRILAGLDGARICYGEPVVSGDRTVIPVARLKSAGGGGFGEGDGEGEGSGRGLGGGGGGWIEATPLGFIDIGPDGARFHAIEDPERGERTIRAGARALTALAGLLALRARGDGVRRRSGARPRSRRRWLRQ